MGCVGECSLLEGPLQIGGGIWDSLSKFDKVSIVKVYYIK